MVEEVNLGVKVNYLLVVEEEKVVEEVNHLLVVEEVSHRLVVEEAEVVVEVDVDCFGLSVLHLSQSLKTTEGTK